MVNLELSKKSLQEQVLKALKSWGEAIVSKDMRALVDLYDNHAQLKPTLSSHIRRNKEEVLSYFIGGGKFRDIGFFQQDITEVEFLESNPQFYGAFVVDTGKYHFVKKDGERLQASYTFVFQYIENKMKIIAHHSSSI